VGWRGTREQYDHVVNALWDGRLAVDKTIGLQPERPWLYRVKHYLRVRVPEVASTLPSTTIVLGAFGTSSYMATVICTSPGIPPA
jgi:hypothetical protein